MAAITAVLARYPEEIVTTVTHPATGLPAQKSWLPTVKEVREACEAIAVPLREEQWREERIAKQLAERDQEKPRPTLEELQAKYGKDWGLRDLTKPEKQWEPAPTKSQIAEHYRKYNLQFRPKEDVDNDQHGKSMTHGESADAPI